LAERIAPGMDFSRARMPVRLSMTVRERTLSAVGLRGPLIAAIAYYCGAQAAFLIGTLSDRIFAPFWPPNVILFCALLLVPYRHWWIYIAVVFPAHVVAELGVGMPAWQLLVAFATNCMVALLNAFAVRRFLGGPPWLGNLRKASTYILTTAVVCPAVSALGGAFVPILGGGPGENYWIYWAHWYVANALPSLTIGPVFLSWYGEGLRWLRSIPRRRQIEALLLAAGIVVVCAVAFQFSVKAAELGLLPVLLYAPLPLILWTAVRFGERGASAAILVVTLVSVWRTLNGPSPFSDQDPERNVLALQLFLTGVSVPVLLLGALIDELRRAERIARDLAQSLLRTQDEEGRRIAKELHDSTGQNLVAARLLIHGLRDRLPKDAKSAVEEVNELLLQSIGELRTVSYLLHPLVLDEGGLAIALRNYVDGFAERSSMRVELEFADDMERLPANAELALFRVVQEALTNVYRHSGSALAKIRMVESESSAGRSLVLSIEDEGTGVPTSTSSPMPEQASSETVRNLGLSRMRERMDQVGGRLEVHSGARGTIVRAILPVLDRTQSL
jgi:signal transduction histidine kinase